MSHDLSQQLLQGNTPGARCYQSFLNKTAKEKSKNCFTYKVHLHCSIEDNVDKERSALELLQEHSTKKSNEAKIKTEPVDNYRPSLSKPFSELELFAPDITLSDNKENINRTLTPANTKKNPSLTSIETPVTRKKRAVLTITSESKEKERLAKQRTKVLMNSHVFFVMSCDQDHAVAILSRGEAEEIRSDSIKERVENNLKEEALDTNGNVTWEVVRSGHR